MNVQDFIDVLVHPIYSAGKNISLFKFKKNSLKLLNTEGTVM